MAIWTVNFVAFLLIAKRDCWRWGKTVLATGLQTEDFATFKGSLWVTVLLKSLKPKRIHHSAEETVVKPESGQLQFTLPHSSPHVLVYKHLVGMVFFFYFLYFSIQHYNSTSVYTTKWSPQVYLSSITIQRTLTTHFIHCLLVTTV